MARSWLVAACVFATLLARVASMVISGDGGGDCMVSFEAASYTVDEGGSVQVMVRLTAMGSLASNITVNVTSDDGTAVAGDDYEAVSAMVEFTEPNTTQVVMVSAVADMEVEGPENLTLSLSTDPMTGVMVVGPVTVPVTINDRSVRIGFEMASYTVQEGMVQVVAVMVEAGGNIDGNLMVNVTSEDGTALLSESDYVQLEETLTFTSDVLSYTQTVAVTALTDMTLENPESLTLSLSSDNPLVDAASSATVTITDTTMATVRFNESMVTVMEGDTAMPMVMIDQALDRDVVVTATPIPGSAEAADYDVAATVTLSAGSNAGAFLVRAEEDMVVEEGEVFTLSLSSTDPAVMGAGEVLSITITDNTMLEINFDQTEYTVMEGGTVNATLTVADEFSLDRPANVSVQPSDTPDYTIDPSILIFSESARSIVVVITAEEDHLVEVEEETEEISLISLDTLLSPSQASLTINDTTIEVMVSPSPIMVAEGGTAETTISTNDVLTESFLVEFSPVSNEDFSISPRNLMFSPGSTSHNLTITAKEDSVVEGEEPVEINVTSSASNFAEIKLVVVIEDRTVNLSEAPDSRGVEVGGSTTFTCVFEAGSPVNIQWEKDGSPISPAPATMNEGMTFSSSVDISSATFGDCGQYTCFVENKASASAYLGVVEFLNTSDPNPVLSVGALAELSCTIRSCGDISIIWDIYPDNAITVNINETTSNSTAEGGPELTDTVSVATVDTVGTIHSGNAQRCSVLDRENLDVTFQEFNYTLQNVNVSVAILREFEDGDRFREGDNVTFNCTATNPPGISRPLIFSWIQARGSPIFRPINITAGNEPEGIRLRKGDGYAELIFNNIQDDEAIEREYICRVTNRLPRDTVDKVVEVNVISGPNVQFPENGSTHVNVGDDLTVTCSTDNSNPSVTNISIFAGAELVKTTASASEQSLSYSIRNANLTNNGTVFKCAAVNEIGTTTKKFSLIVRDVPEAVSSSTIEVEVLSLLVTKLSWEPPTPNNAPILNYTVTVSYVEGGRSESVSTEVPTVAVRLVPNRPHNITITATNDVGESDPSEVLVVTGATGGANPSSFMATQISDAYLLLEWSLSELVRNVTDYELPDSADFFVAKYSLSQDGEEPRTVPPDARSLLYKVEDVGLDERGQEVIFLLEVVYSDLNINNKLDTESEIKVFVSPEVEIPQNNREVLNKRNLTEGNVFGFSFSWSPPQLLASDALLMRYEIFIDPASGGRQRRQTPTGTVDGDVTSFEYRDGEPYTDYLVSVDGIVDVGGDSARVVALAETTLSTAEGVPSVPQNLRHVDDIGFTTVSLEWDEPLTPNGLISHYHVRQ